MSDNLSRLVDLADALQAEAPQGMNSVRAATCRYAAEELRDKRARLAEVTALLWNVRPYVYGLDRIKAIDAFLQPADSAVASPAPGHQHYFDGSGVCGCGIYDEVNDLRPTSTVSDVKS